MYANVLREKKIVNGLLQRNYNIQVLYSSEFDEFKNITPDKNSQIFDAKPKVDIFLNSKKITDSGNFKTLIDSVKACHSEIIVNYIKKIFNRNKEEKENNNEKEKECINLNFLNDNIDYDKVPIEYFEKYITSEKIAKEDVTLLFKQIPNVIDILNNMTSPNEKRPRFSFVFPSGYLNNIHYEYINKNILNIYGLITNYAPESMIFYIGKKYPDVYMSLLAKKDKLIKQENKNNNEKSDSSSNKQEVIHYYMNIIYSENDPLYKDTLYTNVNKLQLKSDEAVYGSNNIQFNNFVNLLRNNKKYEKYFNKIIFIIANDGFDLIDFNIYNILICNDVVFIGEGSENIQRIRDITMTYWKPCIDQF